MRKFCGSLTVATGLKTLARRLTSTLRTPCLPMYNGPMRSSPHNKPFQAERPIHPFAEAPSIRRALWRN